MSEKLLGLFLIAHGLVHTGLAFAPNPNDPDSKPGAFFTTVDRSWLLSQVGLGAGAVRTIGVALVALSTVGFVLAGLGMLNVLGLSTIWRPLAGASAFTSLLLLALFWHRWLPVGVLIDLATLIALFWPQK